MEKNRTVFYLTGDIDHHSAGLWRARMEQAFAGASGCVVIDLAGVTFMDSSGIGLLLGRYNNLTAKGCVMQLVNVPPAADRLLRMSGIYGIMGKLAR